METPFIPPIQAQNCANCGERVSGEFCSACGQSIRTLKRPISTLTAEFLDGLMSWDGRLWRSARLLYTQPGELTRAYMDGKRARFTPPFRLYLIAVLFFAALMSVSGTTVLGVKIQDRTATHPDSVILGAGRGEYMVHLDVFRPAWEPPPQPVLLQASAPMRQDLNRNEQTAEFADFVSARPTFEDVLLRILRDPIAVERHLSFALTQAVLLMVIGFAVLNLLLHPRAPIISHIVHSFYFHSAVLPVMGVLMLLNLYSARLFPAVSIGFSVVMPVLFVIYVAWADRRAYGSSLFGGILRLPLLVVGYTFLFAVMAAGLAWRAVA